jgi:two-component system, OmpR family, alkaline phosphatase synthesis response regulator PhoP
MSAKTVFIVDDSEIVLDVARAALESADFRVETMGNWAELSELLKREVPDLILMDVRMPDAYGDTALMFFKETHGIENTPIYLFSDLPLEELEQRSRECQADGFISKSWGGERLVEEVSSCISS